MDKELMKAKIQKWGTTGFILFTITLSVNPSFAQVVEGVVVMGEGDCNKRAITILNTNYGFVVADVYTGNFDKGDLVIGELNSYGLHDVLVNGSSGSFYVDDYGLNKSRAAEMCFEE
jgi:hypothetical protein